MTMDDDAIASVIRDARITQYWYVLGPEDARDDLVYRAAVLIDCRVNFRSLKVSLNHSDERSYTSWLPGGTLPVDWDISAVDVVTGVRLGHQPDTSIGEPAERPTLGPERWDEIETDLVDALLRRERLVLFYNPLFEIFSDVRESRSDFLDRSAEVALQEIEPELKRLKHVFELQLEQVREAHVTKRGSVVIDTGSSSAADNKLEIERLLQGRTEFFEVEKRVTSLFTGLAGFVLQMPFAKPVPADDSSDAALELREDLARVEQEAADALNELYTRYLEMVRSFDEFEIRLQPANIRVLRRALLWIPVRRTPAENANPHE